MNNNFEGWVYVVVKHLVSVRIFGVMYDLAFSKLANHQIRHQATQKVGCQPGDCTWHNNTFECDYSQILW